MKKILFLFIFLSQARSLYAYPWGDMCQSASFVPVRQAGAGSPVETIYRSRENFSSLASCSQALDIYIDKSDKYTYACIEYMVYRFCSDDGCDLSKVKNSQSK